MTPEQARNILRAVGEAGATIQALGVLAEADARGEATDAEIVEVIENYLGARRRLENSCLTLGMLGPEL